MIKLNAHRALITAAAISALALVSPAAFSQATASADTGAAASNDILQEITVTAQFRTEKLQETPIAITALSGEQIEARNYQTLPDIASSAPNVTMFENTAAFGKTNAAFIRGIGQADFNLAAAEPGVGIYVDDVYVPSAYGAVLDLMDLERVEILRGPQGTLFGKNSIGGAIRLISKKPQGDDTGFIEATLGDFNRKDFKAGFDIPVIQDTLYLRVSAMSKHSDGYVKRESYSCVNPQPPAGSAATTDSRGYTVNPSAPQYIGANTGTNNNTTCQTGTEGGIDVHGMRAQLRWLANDRIENNFSFYLIDDNSEAAPETLLVGDPSIAPSLAAYNTAHLLPTFGVAYDSRFLSKNFYQTYSSFYDSINGVQIPPENSLHSWGGNDTLDVNITDTMHLKSITAYTGYWGAFADDQDNSPLPIAYAYNVLDHSQFTQEFDLTGKAFDSKLDWAAGVFYFSGITVNRGTINLQYNAGNTFSLFPLPGVIPFGAPGGIPFPGNFFGLENFTQDSPATDKNEGVFLQGTYHVTDAFNITAGARETHEKKEYTYQSFFGRIGPFEETYSHPDWKVVGNYQFNPDIMGYVSASTGFRGGGFNPRPFAATQINSFQPEKLTEYEVGLKSEWFEHRLRANVAAFYGNYQNLQLTSQRLDTTGTPYTGIYNVGKARITGAELEIEARPAGGLLATLAAGYTDFKYQNLGDSVGCAVGQTTGCVAGNPGYSDIPPGQPKTKVNVGIAYEVPLGDAGMVTPRLDVTYQSQVFADVVNQTPDAIIPAHTLLNGRIQWQSQDARWSVAALGTNLTNKQYYISIFDLRAFGEGQESAQPGAPRQWALQVTRKFQ
jgi:iron complex outermembrane receptor protein